MEYTKAQLINNEQTGDFELIIEGYRSFINYKIKEDKAHLLHTEVPEELGGKGIAALLVTKTFEYLEERGFKVVPVCTYIQHFLKRRPQWLRLFVEIE